MKNLKSLIFVFAILVLFTGSQVTAQDLPEVYYQILSDSTIKFMVEGPFLAVDSLVIHNAEDEPYGDITEWIKASEFVVLSGDQISVIFTPKHKAQPSRLFYFMFYTKGQQAGWVEKVIGPEDNLPEPDPNFGLTQNYPNPFNAQTTILYSVEKSRHVELFIFNVLGQKVAVLVNEVKNAGDYTVNLNANNLTSGVYFYQLKTGNSTRTMKMVVAE